MGILLLLFSTLGQVVLAHIDDWQLYGYNETVSIYTRSDQDCGRNEVQIKIEDKKKDTSTVFSLSPFCSDIYVVGNYTMHMTTVAGDIYIGIETDGGEKSLKYRINEKEYIINKEEFISLLPNEGVDYSNDELYGCYFIGASTDVFLFYITMHIPDTDVGEEFLLFIYPQRRELLPFFSPLDESE